MHSGLPLPGFQAIILCGPGASLNTFTSIPDEFPKALVPIANRPMVWYPLDWCYRMGIVNITLVTSSVSQPALEAALSQNPHLTALQPPSPALIAPEGLTLTTGTAELLRLPEVQACIKSDFIILPCDLICELPGQSLLEAWMMTQGPLDGTTDGLNLVPGTSSLLGVSGEKGGRRGGIGVWYPISSNQEKPKDDVADFLVTAPLSGDDAPPVHGNPASPLTIRASMQKVVYTMPMDSLKDIIEEKKAFLLRHSLLQQHARVKLTTTYRDAHIYFFPYWVKEMANKNEKFESISEDLVGWWAKAEWQKGLPEKLGLPELFQAEKEIETTKKNKRNSGHIEEEIDLMSMSTTKGHWNNNIRPDEPHHPSSSSSTHPSHSPTTTTAPDHQSSEASTTPSPDNPIPSILAYINSTQPSAPLIRRADNSALLLSISLRLATIPSVADVTQENPTATPSPLAHPHKIANPAGIAPRCTITRFDCLLADGVTVEEKCMIKESVIGANCHIATGSRLTRCVLMDGVVIGERCNLTECIIGRRCKVGRDSIMKDCEVQNGNMVPDETDAKDEKFMIFEGLDQDMEGGDMGDEEGESIDFGTGNGGDGEKK